MQIGELAAQSGVPAKTIRYYESVGLLPPPARAANNYREYQAMDVERLRFIASARSLSFALGEIADILAAPIRVSRPASGYLARSTASSPPSISASLTFSYFVRTCTVSALKGPSCRVTTLRASPVSAPWSRPTVRTVPSHRIVRRAHRMSTCCASDTKGQPCAPLAPTGGQDTRRCPACGGEGKTVAVQTVRALVAVSLREVRGQHYRFCATPTCAVVYYEADTGASFTRDQLRERVYQKEPGCGDILICYCFQHTAGAVQGGDHERREAIIADITAGIKADQCACDLRNPQGSCCLGNVRGLVRRLAQQ